MAILHADNSLGAAKTRAEAVDAAAIILQGDIIRAAKGGYWIDVSPSEASDRNSLFTRNAPAGTYFLGKKTAREIQDENSLFPMDAVIEMKWAEYSERFERTHA